jgi:hypothetical protein
MENLTYKWFIPSLTVIKSQDGLDNIITTIHWSRQITDGTTTAYANGAIGINPPDVNDFIPYESITKEQIISWLESTLNVEEINAVALHEYNAIIAVDNIETIAPPFGV